MLKALQANALLPFVPSGSNYADSIRLFKRIGFEELWHNEGTTGLKLGDGAAFILQKYDNREFAENLMLQVNVPNLDAWWQEVEAMDLPQNFPGVKLKAPFDYPYGREVHMIDLAGVCWHICE